jgi:diguanylate cyclase (GGDEF)-like protein
MNKKTFSRLVSRSARFLAGRSLLGDFFFLHLGFATFVGLLSIFGLWHTSNWVIDENLRKWAVQWVERLDTLGTPLYVAVDDEEFERVREYARSFSEIAFVRYYTPAGELLHEEKSSATAVDVPYLQIEDLKLLAKAARDGEPYQLDRKIKSGEIFRANKSLWAESILADGLFGFDPEAGGQEERTLLGFVELGLDFEHYRGTMTRRVLQGSVGILVALFLLAIFGLIGFRRALRPLRKFQEPLNKLAEGDLDVTVDSGGHAELIAINDALATTINALHLRDQKLRESVNYDPLTGLMGRTGLNQDLQQEIHRVHMEDCSSALLFVDLDQFKYVNDSVGHAAGDRLLIRVAGLFRILSDDDDLVYRYGGDEFIVIRRNAGRDDAEQLSSLIVESMRDIQFVEDGRAFNVRCSIGVAMINSSSIKPEEILAQADMACHDAKGQGRNRFQIFTGDAGDRERTASDMGWSDRIREALKNDGFSLRYQPIIPIGDGPTSMYEVLLRMRGHGRKIIPPGGFLPAADRFGLTGDLDYWVIRNAFEKLAEVRETRPDIVFALNLSGIVFSDARLVEYVEEQLARFGIPGSAIVFEITEQVAIRYIEDATTIMLRLINVGCQFALDDFGSGFSSFNYLKQLPVSYIKIDGAFIENLATDPADRAIVTAIAQIARTVGTKTIAEHVRNEETMAMLGEIGIDFAQGFFLGRPLVDLLDASKRESTGEVLSGAVDL